MNTPTPLDTDRFPAGADRGAHGAERCPAARVAELEATPAAQDAARAKGQKPSLPSVPKGKAAAPIAPSQPDPDVWRCRVRPAGPRVTSGGDPDDRAGRDTRGCTAARARWPSGSRRHRRAWMPNIRAFVIYLRAVQGIPLARLRDALLDLFGLTISEGALVNMLSAAAAPFKAAVSLIKVRLLRHRHSWAVPTGGCGCSITATAPFSSPTSLQDGGGSLPRGSPPRLLLDRLGAQAGWARGLPGAPDPRRPVRRASGQASARTGLRDRAAADDPQKRNPESLRADLERRLDRIMALDPTHPAGTKLKRMILKVRSQLSSSSGEAQRVRALRARRRRGRHQVRHRDRATSNATPHAARPADRRAGLNGSPTS